MNTSWATITSKTRALSVQYMIGLITGYFLIQLVLSPINLLGGDTYYYWAWSRHLALSYFDGPPMIAYLIRLSTFLFGHNLFALNILGIVLTGATTYITYKTARLFLSKAASLVASLLWLFSPAVTITLLLRTTYDTPQAVCWTLTLYFVCQYLKKENYRYLYLTGVAIGLLLLSKYTGIVLPLGLFIFVLFTPYRYLLRSVHLYLACLLALLIVSPVLIWNYQNDWISFLYQLKGHSLASDALGYHNMYTDRSDWYRVMRNIIEKFLPVLNVLLLPVGVCLYKRYDKLSAIIKLCLIVCVSFLCFYLYVSSKVYLKPMWLVPFLSSAVLLAGFCYEKGYFPRMTWGVIVIYIISSLIISITHNPWLYLGIHTKRVNAALIKQFNEDYPQPFQTVLTCNWLEARSLFFLKEHPLVYTLSCPYMHKNLQNQYKAWSLPIQQKIATKEIKEALYIDFIGHGECANRQFDHCERLKTRTFTHHHKAYELFAYRCTNKG